MSKLAGMDSGIERALRVVEFYDQLVLHHADLEAIVRASAILAECAAGASFEASGEICVVNADGILLPPQQEADSLVVPIVVEGTTVGHSWISRRGAAAQEWDELVVVRMSVALASLFERETDVLKGIGLADPAIAHVLLRETASETDASRAARLLGFPIGQRIQLVALNTGDANEVAACRVEIERRVGARAVAAAIGEKLAVVFVATEAHFNLDLVDHNCAIGPAVAVESCNRTWPEVRSALRFASLGGSWSSSIHSRDIGSVLSLVQLDPLSVAKIPDVRLIAKIAAEDGMDDLVLLDRLSTTTSLRSAASALFMHHSSAAYRVARLTERLGFDPRQAEYKLRARLALVLWQLHVGPDRDKGTA